MGVEPNWSILRPVDVGAAFQSGMESGRGERAREALARYYRDPKDGEAFDRLLSIDPQRAMQVRDQMAARGRAERDAQSSEQFGQAAAQYAVASAGGNVFRPDRLTALAPNTNALAQPPVGLNGVPIEQGAVNALMPRPSPVGGVPSAPQGGGVNALLGASAPSPLAAAVSGNAEMAAPADAAATELSPEDDAFIRMVKIDPMRAMEMRGAARERAMDNLRQQDELYAMAAQHLANVSDDASYQQLVGGLAQRFEPLGVDLRSLVPATYPGPEGIRALLARAMTARDQIAALDRAERLDADIADDEADNARADRNTDSQIATRGAQAGISASREARLAAGGNGRGGGRGGRGRNRGRGRPVTAVNPATGERVVLRNGAWVAER